MTVKSCIFYAPRNLGKRHFFTFVHAVTSLLILPFLFFFFFNTLFPRTKGSKRNDTCPPCTLRERVNKNVRIKVDVFNATGFGASGGAESSVFISQCLLLSFLPPFFIFEMDFVNKTMRGGESTGNYFNRNRCFLIYSSKSENAAPRQRSPQLKIPTDLRNFSIKAIKKEKKGKNRRRMFVVANRRGSNYLLLFFPLLRQFRGRMRKYRRAFSPAKISIFTKLNFRFRVSFANFVDSKNWRIGAPRRQIDVFKNILRTFLAAPLEDGRKRRIYERLNRKEIERKNCHSVNRIYYRVVWTKEKRKKKNQKNKKTKNKTKKAVPKTTPTFALFVYAGEFETNYIVIRNSSTKNVWYSKIVQNFDTLFFRTALIGVKE